MFEASSGLRDLRRASGDSRLFAPEEGEIFQVDGVEFVCDYQLGSTPERFYIIKRVPHVREYVELCRRFTGGRILELGVAEGGSAALTVLEAQPAKLVALDIEPEPVAALEGFIEARGLTDSVRPYAGVDQGDRATLFGIVDAEFGADPIDLVVDDASHDLHLTRESFDALYPLVRPGGAFVIEDWASDFLWRQGVVDALRSMDAEQRRQAFAQGAEQSGPGGGEQRPPLSHMVVELMMANALRPDVIASLEVNQFHVVVERGPAELDRSEFRLSDLYTDFHGYLAGS